MNTPSDPRPGTPHPASPPGEPRQLPDANLATAAEQVLEHVVDKVRGQLQLIGTQGLSGFGATIEHQATISTAHRIMTIRVVVETQDKPK